MKHRSFLSQLTAMLMALVVLMAAPAMLVGQTFGNYIVDCTSLITLEVT
jgi:hypothetical protein